jgi:hypothetical protein
MAQRGGCGPQTGGFPTQFVLAHSKLATHAVPSASGGAVQSVRPVPSSAHVAAASQQSVAETQMDPSGRHGPGPRSHLPFASQVIPQHPGPPPEWQSSPDARQGAVGSTTHRPLPPSS